MIENIITYLDTKISALNIFSQQLGLCEKITEVDEENNTKAFPAKYLGKGEYQAAADYDLNDGLIYFRKNGNVTETISDVQAVACRTYFERTYPLRIVAGKKNTLQDTEYLGDTLFEEIRNTIEGQSIKDLKILLKAVKVNVIIDEYDTHRESIFEEEFEGLDSGFPYEYSFVAINITVEVTATNQCFTNVCEAPENSLLCLLINKAPAADIEACITAAEKKSEVCGVCPPFVKVKIFESDGATLVIEKDSGETFTIPKHNIILPDGLTNLESKEFNEDTNLVRAYNKAPLTDHTGIIHVGDDAWHKENGTYTYNTKGIRPILDPSDQTLLAAIAGNENAFGTYDRFTDDAGGQDFITKNYLIDHYTGYAFTYGLANGNATIADNIAWANGLIHNGFSDYRVPNANEIMTIAQHDANRFFLLLGLGDTSMYLSSTKDTSTLFYQAHNSIRRLERAANSEKAFAIRDHYI